MRVKVTIPVELILEVPEGTPALQHAKDITAEIKADDEAPWDLIEAPDASIGAVKVQVIE